MSKRDKTYETERVKFPKDHQYYQPTNKHIKDKIAQLNREIEMWSKWIERDIKRLREKEEEIKKLEALLK